MLFDTFIEVATGFIQVHETFATHFFKDQKESQTLVICSFKFENTSLKKSGRAVFRNEFFWILGYRKKSTVENDPLRWYRCRYSIIFEKFTFCQDQFKTIISNNNPMVEIMYFLASEFLRALYLSSCLIWARTVSSSEKGLQTKIKIRTFSRN